MSFYALLFALSVQYVNDRFLIVETFNDWLTPILKSSLCGDLLMIGLRLSLNSHFVENNGFEPLTPCVQGRCSSQLS